MLLIILLWYWLTIVIFVDFSQTKSHVTPVSVLFYKRHTLLAAHYRSVLFRDISFVCLYDLITEDLIKQITAS